MSKDRPVNRMRVVWEDKVNVHPDLHSVLDVCKELFPVSMLTVHAVGPFDPKDPRTLVELEVGGVTLTRGGAPLLFDWALLRPIFT